MKQEKGKLPSEVMRDKPASGSQTSLSHQQSFHYEGQVECAHCQKPVAAVPREFSGVGYKVRGDNVVHKECYEAFLLAEADICAYSECKGPILRIKGKYDGNFYPVADGGKVHSECWRPYCKVTYPACIECKEPCCVWTSDGGKTFSGQVLKFKEGRQCHKECFEMYQRKMSGKGGSETTTGLHHLTAKITGYEVFDFTTAVYTIKVDMSPRTWFVYRSFANFEALVETLKEEGTRSVPALPSSSFLERLTPNYHEEQMRGLQEFLDLALKSEETEGATALHAFLEDDEAEWKEWEEDAAFVASHLPPPFHAYRQNRLKNSSDQPNSKEEARAVPLEDTFDTLKKKSSNFFNQLWPSSEPSEEAEAKDGLKMNGQSEQEAKPESSNEDKDSRNPCLFSSDTTFSDSKQELADIEPSEGTERGVRLQVVTYQTPDWGNTIYTIKVINPPKNWLIFRSFSNFDVLVDELRSEGHQSIPELPSDGFLDRLKPSFQAEQMKDLQKFLNQAAESPKIASAPAFQKFLEMANTDATTSSAKDNAEQDLGNSVKATNISSAGQDSRNDTPKEKLQVDTKLSEEIVNDMRFQVVTYQTPDGGAPIYTIKAIKHPENWLIFRSFSNFEALVDNLRSEEGHHSIPELPNVRLLDRSKPSVQEEQMKGLEQFLNRAAKSETIAGSPAFQRFLELAPSCVHCGEEVISKRGKFSGSSLETDGKRQVHRECWDAYCAFHSCCHCKKIFSDVSEQSLYSSSPDKKEPRRQSVTPTNLIPGLLSIFRGAPPATPKEESLGLPIVVDGKYKVHEKCLEAFQASCCWHCKQPFGSCDAQLDSKQNSDERPVVISQPGTHRKGSARNINPAQDAAQLTTLQVEVTGYEVFDFADAVYTIKVSFFPRNWLIYRSFANFEDFVKNFEEEGNKNAPPLPSHGLMERLNPTFHEGKMKELEEFLNLVIKSTSGSQSEALLAFLEIDMEQWSGWESDAEFVYSHLPPPSVGGRRLSAVSNISLAGVDKEEDNQTTHAGLQETKPAYKVHEKCVAAFYQSRCVQCVDLLVPSANGKFSGKQEVTDDGKVHAECYESYKKAKSPACVQCTKKIFQHGTFSGDSKMIGDGRQVHKECFIAYIERTAPVCSYCSEKIYKIEGKFSGDQMTLAETNGVCHKECFSQYRVSASEKCNHCSVPVATVSDQFSGLYYTSQDATGSFKVHKECWDAWQEACKSRPAQKAGKADSDLSFELISYQAPDWGAPIYTIKVIKSPKDWLIFRTFSNFEVFVDQLRLEGHQSILELPSVGLLDRLKSGFQEKQMKELQNFLNQTAEAVPVESSPAFQRFLQMTDNDVTESSAIDKAAQESKSTSEEKSQAEPALSQESALSLQVDTYQKPNQGPAVYTIKASKDPKKWQIFRSFSNFEGLVDNLRSEGHRSIPELASVKLSDALYKENCGAYTRLKPTFEEEQMKDLQIFLNRAAESVPIASSPAFQRFVELAPSCVHCGEEIAKKGKFSGSFQETDGKRQVHGECWDAYCSLHSCSHCKNMFSEVSEQALPSSTPDCEEFPATKGSVSLTNFIPGLLSMLSDASPASKDDSSSAKREDLGLPIVVDRKYKVHENCLDAFQASCCWQCKQPFDVCESQLDSKQNSEERPVVITQPGTKLKGRSGNAANETLPLTGLQVEVTAYEVFDFTDAVYTIKVSCSPRSWLIYRSFANFEDLVKQFEEEDNQNCPPLPSHGIMQRLNPTFHEGKMKELEEFLNLVIKSPTNSQWNALLPFLEINLEQWSGWESDAEFLYSHLPPPSPAGKRNSVSQASVAGVGEKEFNQTNDAGLLGTKASYKVHEKCVAAFYQTRCVQCVDLLEPSANGQFSGKQEVTVDGKVHAECYESYKRAKSPPCVHCTKKIFQHGTFSGDSKMLDDGQQVHEECYSAYMGRNAPACSYCNEKIFKVEGKFSGVQRSLSGTTDVCHEECLSQYQLLSYWKCRQCSIPVTAISQQFSGLYYTEQDGTESFKVHKECWDAWQEASKTQEAKLGLSEETESGLRLQVVSYQKSEGGDAVYTIKASKDPKNWQIFRSFSNCEALVDNLRLEEHQSIPELPSVGVSDRSKPTYEEEQAKDVQHFLNRTAESIPVPSSPAFQRFLELAPSCVHCGEAVIEKKGKFTGSFRETDGKRRVHEECWDAYCSLHSCCHCKNMFSDASEQALSSSAPDCDESPPMKRSVSLSNFLPGLLSILKEASPASKDDPPSSKLEHLGLPIVIDNKYKVHEKCSDAFKASCCLQCKQPFGVYDPRLDSKQNSEERPVVITQPGTKLKGSSGNASNETVQLTNLQIEVTGYEVFDFTDAVYTIKVICSPRDWLIYRSFANFEDLVKRFEEEGNKNCPPLPSHGLIERLNPTFHESKMKEIEVFLNLVVKSPTGSQWDTLLAFLEIDMEQWSGWENDAEFVYSHLPPPSAAGKLHSTASNASLLEAAKEEEKQQNAAGLKETKVTYKVHEKCVAAFYQTRCVQCVDLLVPSANEQFSGKQETTVDGKVHAECYESYKRAKSPACVHCTKKIFQHGTFSGDSKMLDDGQQVHDECYVAYMEKTAPACSYCTEKIYKVEGKFSGVPETLTGTTGVCHEECISQYRLLTSEKCRHCNVPVAAISQQYSGLYYAAQDDSGSFKVHNECWDAWQEASKKPPPPAPEVLPPEESDLRFQVVAYEAPDWAAPVYTIQAIQSPKKWLIYRSFSNFKALADNLRLEGPVAIPELPSDVASYRSTPAVQEEQMKDLQGFLNRAAESVPIARSPAFQRFLELAPSCVHCGEEVVAKEGKFSGAFQETDGKRLVHGECWGGYCSFHSCRYCKDMFSAANEEAMWLSAMDSESATNQPSVSPTNKRSPTNFLPGLLSMLKGASPASKNDSSSRHGNPGLPIVVEGKFKLHGKCLEPFRANCCWQCTHTCAARPGSNQNSEERPVVITQPSTQSKDASLSGVGKEQDKRKNVAGSLVVETKPAYKVHEKCVADFFQTHCVQCVDLLVPSANGQFSGKQEMVKEGRIHSECWESYSHAHFPLCVHCNQPCSEHGNFSGMVYEYAEGKECHLECFGAYSKTFVKKVVFHSNLPTKDAQNLKCLFQNEEESKDKSITSTGKFLQFHKIEKSYGDYLVF